MLVANTVKKKKFLFNIKKKSTFKVFIFLKTFSNLAVRTSRGTLFHHLGAKPEKKLQGGIWELVGAVEQC